MKLTKQQLKTLKGKCPKCKGSGDDRYYGSCDNCLGHGQATIEIEKELVEYKHYWTSDECEICNAEKIPKSKVGDYLIQNIENGEVKKLYEHIDKIIGFVKLKIISETETHWKVIMI